MIDWSLHSLFLLFFSLRLNLFVLGWQVSSLKPYREIVFLILLGFGFFLNSCLLSFDNSVLRRINRSIRDNSRNRFWRGCSRFGLRFFWLCHGWGFHRRRLRSRLWSRIRLLFWSWWGLRLLHSRRLNGLYFLL